MPVLTIDDRPVEVALVEETWSSMDEIHHEYLTCRNHPTALYLTKNPASRSLHIIRYPDGTAAECDCPFSDLVVLRDGDPRSNR